MIRVNLLPSDKKKRVRSWSGAGAAASAATGSGSPALWWGIYGAALAIWIACLGGAYYLKSNELEAITQENLELEKRRDQLQRKTEGLAEVEAKLEKSRRLEKVVSELERARTGPTRAIMELSNVLSTGAGPTIDAGQLEAMRKENPLAGFNEGWDVRRLWIKSFQETGGECKIDGTGRTNDDVAEFLRRLSLSELFDDVTLQRTRSEANSETGLKFIGFSLSCKVKY